VLLAGEELTAEAVAAVVERLAARGRDELREAGGDAEPELRASYDLRYAGQAFELHIAGDPAPEPDALRRAFDRAHEDRYGYADADAGLELVSVRVAVALPGAEPRPAAWEGLPDGTTKGPAVVRLPGSTLVVPDGWRARAEDDVVVMER
jgi:N-methylhydantoinase A/oxoprolinase/acetone carboxylase beta subunit